MALAWPRLGHLCPWSSPAPSPLLDASIGGFQGSPSPAPLPSTSTCPGLTLQCGLGAVLRLPGSCAQSRSSGASPRLGAQEQPRGGGTWLGASGDWGLATVPRDTCTDCSPPPPLRGMGHCARAEVPLHRPFHSRNSISDSPTPHSPWEGPFRGRYQSPPLPGLRQVSGCPALPSLVTYGHPAAGLSSVPRTRHARCPPQSLCSAVSSAWRFFPDCWAGSLGVPLPPPAPPSFLGHRLKSASCLLFIPILSWTAAGTSPSRAPCASPRWTLGPTGWAVSVWSLSSACCGLCAVQGAGRR